MKRIYFYLFIVFLCSCGGKKCNEEDSNDITYFNKKHEGLVVKKSDKQKIKLIELEQDNNCRQVAVLDSNNRIIELQNVIAIYGDSMYVNTWIGFDSQNNFDFSKSYYYETSLINENDHIFIECYLPNLVLNKPRCYVLLNDFDKEFKTTKPSDTLLFSKDYLVRIPVKKYQKGKNNMKFIIVEDQWIGNKLKMKKTYVNKDFIVAKRPISQ